MPPNHPSLIEIVPKVGEEHVRTVILTPGSPTGNPPMLAFSNLTVEEMDDFIAFPKIAKYTCDRGVQLTHHHAKEQPVVPSEVAPRLLSVSVLPDRHFDL